MSSASDRLEVKELASSFQPFLQSPVQLRQSKNAHPSNDQSTTAPQIRWPTVCGIRAATSSARTTSAPSVSVITAVDAINASSSSAWSMAYTTSLPPPATRFLCRRRQRNYFIHKFSGNILKNDASYQQHTDQRSQKIIKSASCWHHRTINNAKRGTLRESRTLKKITRGQQSFRNFSPKRQQILKLKTTNFNHSEPVELEKKV
jgi:hypothetical protein